MSDAHQNSQPNNWVKEQAGHLTGHLIHDLLKEALVAVVGTALIYSLKQHVQAVWLICLTFIVMLTLLLGTRITRSRQRNISVLSDNSKIVEEVGKLLKWDSKNIKRVTIVQYSGKNILGVIKQIMRETSADVEVFLVKPSSAINKHQTDRTNEGLATFLNDTCEIRTSARVKRFLYDAPGAIRAVLIEGHVLFFGAYQYEVIDKLGDILDIRGGDDPLFMVPYNNPNFEMLASAVRQMVENWKYKENAVGQVTAEDYAKVLAERAKA
jgi:hypothetical protein